MKIKQHVYVTQLDQFLLGNYAGTFSLADGDYMKDVKGWHLIGEISFNVNLDMQSLRSEAIETIKLAENEERADHEVRMNMLREKKQSLLAIPHMKGEL